MRLELAAGILFCALGVAFIWLILENGITIYGIGGAVIFGLIGLFTIGEYFFKRIILSAPHKKAPE